MCQLEAQARSRHPSSITFKKVIVNGSMQLPKPFRNINGAFSLYPASHHQPTNTPLTCYRTSIGNNSLEKLKPEAVVLCRQDLLQVKLLLENWIDIWRQEHGISIAYKVLFRKCDAVHNTKYAWGPGGRGTMKNVHVLCEGFVGRKYVPLLPEV